MTQIAYKKPGRRPVKPDDKLLAELYNRHTAQEIADMYGVKRSTVKGWIRKARQEEAEKEG